MGIGEKVVSHLKGAYRIGKKVYGFFKGNRVGGKETTTARDKFSEDVKAISSEDFVEPEVVDNTPSLQPNTPRGLTKATGIRGAINKVKAVKQAVKLAQNPPDNLPEIKRQLQRVKDTANKPSKKSVRGHMEDQREMGQAYSVGNMTSKEFKKFQKKSEKKAKKRSKKKRFGVF